MKKKIAGSTFIALLMFCSASFAGGGCFGCKIRNLGSGPYYDSICASGSSCVFVAMETAISNRPACSSNSYWHFALDISTTSGRATYAFLLAAYSSGELVNVAGADSCSLSPSGAVENLHYANYAN